MQQRMGVWEVVTWNMANSGWYNAAITWNEKAGKMQRADPNENLTFLQATEWLASLVKNNEKLQFKIRRRFPAPDMSLPEAERRAGAVVELNFKAHYSNYAVMYDEGKKALVDAPELITKAEALRRWEDYQKRFAPTMFIVQSFA